MRRVHGVFAVLRFAKYEAGIRGNTVECGASADCGVMLYEMSVWWTVEPVW